MPAKAVAHSSVDCAYASEVTESSSRDRLMSTTSDSSCFLEALRSVWVSKTVSVDLRSQRSTYNLIAYSTPTFSASSTDEQKAAVLWIEVCCVEGVGQSDLSIGYWRCHWTDKSSPEGVNLKPVNNRREEVDSGYT